MTAHDPSRSTKPHRRDDSHGVALPVSARSCWCCKVAARSAPTRLASTRHCMKPASSRTG